MNVQNEFNKLSRVVLGIPDSFGGTPRLEDAYDPKSKQHIKAGTFPSQEDITKEMNSFSETLSGLGIDVVRPKVIENYNQIFARDIAVVVDNKFLIANVIKDRKQEIDALTGMIDKLDDDIVIEAPDGVRFEGGDIMPHNEYLFIGYSEEPDFSTYKVARTNSAGVNFFKEQFPEKKVKTFELNKSDIDPKKNALHLDCCFQPFGLGHAIIHKPGFKNPEDAVWLIDYFGKENCLLIDENQMYDMGANLFSVDKDHVISEVNFHEVNDFLESKGYKVTKIQYAEIAKMEGLLRCSTMPIHRA